MKDFYNSDVMFWIGLILLMLLFWGEPDLFDAIRDYLIHKLQEASV